MHLLNNRYKVQVQEFSVKKTTIVLVRLLAPEDGGSTLVRMLSHCLPVDMFRLDELVGTQLDKKFSVFYTTQNIIITVFGSPLSSAYPEPFVALYSLNLLKPTGHVMRQQFNIQQLYVLSTLYLCVLYLPENKQRLVQLTA